MCPFPGIVVRGGRQAFRRDTALVLRALSAHLRLCHYISLDVDIVTMATMAQYNQEFKLKRGPTDVLTFVNRDVDCDGHSVLDLIDDALRTAADEDGHYLGRVILCPDYIWATSARHRRSYLPPATYTKVALVHAFCHGLGYNHDGDDDHAEMVKQEKALLRHLTRLTRMGKLPQCLFHSQ